MSSESPEPGEVWQEADGHLMKCWPPGIWIRFGSPVPVPPTDGPIAFPLRRVFTRFGVPTMDDPIKTALLEDLELAQADRDRWRAKATWLSQHVTTDEGRKSGLTEEQQQEQAEEAGFIPPPTTSEEATSE